MGILTTLGQYYTTYDDSVYTTTSGSAEGAAAAAGIAIFFIFLYFIILIGVYVVSAIFLGRIFKKAGVPSWISWVPFYNNWKFLEIGGQQGFWAVLAIIPFVNIVSAVFSMIAAYHIGKKLGKDGAFFVLALFLPLVWLIWLGADKSEWHDKQSTAPSLDPLAAAKV